MSSIPVIVVFVLLCIPVCIFVYIRLKNSGVFHVSDWSGESERDFYYTVPEPDSVLHANSVPMTTNWKIDLNSIHMQPGDESIFGTNSNVLLMSTPPGWI